MGIMEELMEKLLQIRYTRAQLINQLYEEGDLNTINNMIADVVNIMEGLFLIINHPVDSFVSLSPAPTEDENAT